VRVVSDLDQQSLCFEVRPTTRFLASNRSSPAYGPAAALIFGVIGHGVDLGQIMAAANFKVIRIVRRK